jgi:hypothetical protein
VVEDGVILPGLGNELTTVTGRVLLLEPQPFIAVTITFPLVVFVVAVMDNPPAPVLVTFQPEGTDHV